MKRSEQREVRTHFGEDDREALVRGVCVPSTPDRGPSYSDGGVQGDPAYVEAMQVSLDGGKTWICPEDAGLSEKEIEAAEDRLLQDP